MGEEGEREGGREGERGMGKREGGREGERGMGEEGEREGGREGERGMGNEGEREGGRDRERGREGESGSQLVNATLSKAESCSLTIHVKTPQSEPFFCLGMPCKGEWRGERISSSDRDKCAPAHLGKDVGPALQTQLCLLLVAVFSHQVVSQGGQTRQAPPPQRVIVAQSEVSVVDNGEAPVRAQVDGIEH